MKVFFMLTAVPYDDEMKQRPQHIVENLAKMGFEVIYIYATSSKKITADQYEDFMKDFRLCDYVMKINKNLYVIDRFDEIIKDNKSEIIKFSKVLKHLQEFYKNQEVYFICEHPKCIDILEELEENSFIIYDCIDDWTEFAKDIVWEDETIVTKERQLASISKLITVSAKRLYCKMYPYNKNIFYFPNGVNVQDYDKIDTNIVPSDLKNISKPIIFFMGTLAQWVDMEIIEFIARSRPDYSFVFVGNKYNVELPHYDNIYYLGVKNYQELKYYLNKADVAIIPFKINKLIASVSPLKFFEYISAGVPVVSTILPELIGEDSIYLAKDKEEFLFGIDDIINLTKHEYLDLSMRLKKNSFKYEWSILIENFIKYIDMLQQGMSIEKDKFLKETIDNYENYDKNDIVKNELLTMYNLIKNYELAYEKSNKLERSNSLIFDFNQAALACFNVGEFDKAIMYINDYIEKNNINYYKKYINKIKDIMDINEKNIIIEVLLLKFCNRIYEALKLLDDYLAISNSPNPTLFSLLASLYLDLNEEGIAIEILSSILQYLDNNCIFEPNSISLIIDLLIKQKELNLVETILNYLYDVGLEEIANDKWALFYFHKYFNNQVDIKYNDIGFVFSTPLHYYLYKDTIFELEKRGILPHIIINDYMRYDENYRNMYIENMNFLYKEFNNKYKILFLSDIKKYGIKYKCLITNTYYGKEVMESGKYNFRFMYGFAKEVYACSWWNILYDKIFCFGSYDFNKLNIYNTCEKVGYPKFDRWFTEKELLKKEAIKDFALDKNKKTLLYTPTYGRLSSIDSWLEIIYELKENYNIIIKLHHGTAYLKEEEDRKNKIFNLFENVVDDKYDILRLFAVSDYLLFDNSGILFDGILSDINLIKLYMDIQGCEEITDYRSIEQKISNEIITVYNGEDLKKVLENENIFEYQKEIRIKLRNEFFQFTDGKSSERVVNVIMDYISDKIEEKNDNFFRQNLLSIIKKHV